MSSQPEENYVIEDILKKRVRNGKTQYYVKWQGYPDSGNTWEPKKNIGPQMIRIFNKKKRNEATVTTAQDMKLNVKSEQESEETTSAGRKQGFGRGLEAERIIGITNVSDELTMLMKWKDSDDPDLVPAKEANLKCPQVVIKFYEKHLQLD